MTDVTIADVEAARGRIADLVHRTPILTSVTLANISGLEYLGFKCEVFQRTGSFKFRGASNAVNAYIAHRPNITTFVTHSSGNHGQAVAKAARDAAKQAVVVVPCNAPKVKTDCIVAYGATIIQCAPTVKDREETCARVLRELGPKGQLVHPFDDPLVIAGQGTIGVELVEQLRAAAQTVDAVVVPVGGGGMISGIAIAMKALMPGVRVIGAEPSAVDDASRAFHSRSPTPLPLVQDPANTMGDGLRGTLSQRTLNHIRAYVDDIVTVTEAEMAIAMRLVMERLKVVIEPSAATGAAVALLKRESLGPAKRVAVILCGGNVSLDGIPTFVNKL